MNVVLLKDYRKYDSNTGEKKTNNFQILLGYKAKMLTKM